MVNEDAATCSRADGDQPRLYTRASRLSATIVRAWHAARNAEEVTGECWIGVVHGIGELGHEASSRSPRRRLSAVGIRAVLRTRRFVHQDPRAGPRGSRPGR